MGFYFQSVLIACVYRKSRGYDHSLASGFSIVNSRIGSIILWSLMAATIGIILKTLQDRCGEFGRILLGLIGIAWSIVSYFVLPVVVIEGLSPKEALPRSAALFKSTWGESLSANFSLVIFQMLGIFASLAIMSLMLVFQESLFLSTLFLALGCACLVMVFVSIQAMEGVIHTALYLHGANRELPGRFDDEMLEEAFIAK